MVVIFFVESEDFDPDQGFNKPAATDRWDGEDEEPDVKVRFGTRSFFDMLTLEVFETREEKVGGYIIYMYKQCTLFTIGGGLLNICYAELK